MRGIVLAAVMFACAGARAADTPLDTLMAWSQGCFDNAGQAARDPRYFLMTACYRAVAVPAVGEHVLLAQEYRGEGAARRLHSARLQVLQADGGGVRVSFRPLRRPETVGDDPAAIARLTPDDLQRFGPECDIVLHDDGGSFRGAMAPRGCRRGPEAYFEYELAVGPKEQRFREQARRFADGAVTWEQAPGSGFGFFELVRTAP
jgi:hypothetical protein